MSDDALDWHRRAHIPAALRSARESDVMASSAALLAQLHDLQARCLSLLDQAEAGGDLRSALGAIREARGVIETIVRVRDGDLADRIDRLEDALQAADQRRL